MKIATLNFCLGLAILLHTLTVTAEEMIVVRGDEDYPPMEMVVNGMLTGFHVDIVNEVSKAMGVTVQWKSVPWKRALSMIEKGKADGITYISRNTKREKFAIFLDGNVLSSSTVIFLSLKRIKTSIYSTATSRSLLATKQFSNYEVLPLEAP